MSKTRGPFSYVHHQLGHAGRHKTEHSIRQRPWWPLLHRDVIEFCQNCDFFSHNKEPTQTPGAPVVLRLTQAPNQRVEWCDTVPLQQQDANGVAKAFTDNWITRFGAPHSLHSDQGAALESQLVHHICNVFDIRKTRTTAYHPEGNGLTERTNLAIKNIPRSFLSRLPNDDWDETLPQWFLTYRFSIHSSTVFVSALHLYDQELRLSGKVQVPPLSFEKTDHAALATAWQLLIIWSARNNSRQAIIRRMCTIISLVARRLSCLASSSPGPSSKNYSPWFGPFEILWTCPLQLTS
ncbi:unnamed protein product [Trichobilharzia regenti]|nr:unnamed protein product [Trichobilharzia regenti]